MNECELKNSILAYSLPPLSEDEERKMFRAYISGDKSLKEDLFRHNIRLVVYLLDRFYDKNKRKILDYEDLLQEGLVGLLKAIEKNNPESDCPFSVYARKWIMAYIRRAIYGKDNVIHIPEEAYRFYCKNKDKVVSNRNDMKTVECVERALQVQSYDIQVNADKETENGMELIFFIPTDKAPIDELLTDRELNEIVRKEIDLYVETYYPNNKQKREQTRYVINTYFGIDTDPLTVSEMTERIVLSVGGIWSKIYAFLSYCQTRPWINDYRDYI